MSRYIAISAIGLWLISYVLGVGVLTTEARNRRSPFDELLESGSRQWAIRDKKTDSCVGLLESNFSVEKKPELSLIGSVTVPVYGVPTIVALKFHSQFTSYYKLEGISAEVRAGQSALTVMSNPGAPTNLKIEVHTPSNFQTVSLTRPEPIYLVERQQGQFSVRFPSAIQSLIEAPTSNTANATSLSGMQITPLAEADRSSCLQTPDRIESQKGIPSGIIDLGKIFEFLHITPRPSDIVAITQQDT